MSSGVASKDAFPLSSPLVFGHEWPRSRTVYPFTIALGSVDEHCHSFRVVRLCGCETIGSAESEQPFRTAHASRYAEMGGKASVCLMRKICHPHDKLMSDPQAVLPYLSAERPLKGMTWSARPWNAMMGTTRPGLQSTRGFVSGYSAGETGAKAAIKDAVEGVQASKFVCAC